MELNNMKDLTSAEVQRNREEYGSNEIFEAPPETFMQKVISNLKDPMLILLLVIATLMLILSFFGQANWYESLGTYISVALVACISATTEMASDKKYRELKESTKHELIKVYRNGKVTTVDITEIVVGDLVILQSGDKIPADGCLISGEISVNNAALNGETTECKKRADGKVKFPNNITGDTLVDKRSLFRGATVYDGEGIMKVFRVGMSTMMGEMSKDMEDSDIESPLKLKLRMLAQRISKFGYIGAIVIGFVYIIHYIILAGGVTPYISTGFMPVLKSILRALSISIMIVVCAVPEGLPLMIAIVLAYNSSNLYKANVLVRKAIGIETAGSINILFSDKTGTITKGELEVTEFFTADGESISVENLSAEHKRLLDISIGKNTNSMFSEHEVIGGNSTDQALLRFIRENTFNILQNEYEVTKQQAFNSTNKFSQAYLKSLNKTFYKGAPEKLLVSATKCLNTQGEIVDIDKEALNKTMNELADKAMRVLAFGYSEKEFARDTINDDIVILGLVGIRDEVRPEARDAIKVVQNAGIQVVMITGDRLETAVAIGKDTNLLTGNIAVIRAEDVTSDQAVISIAEKVDALAINSEALNKMKDSTIKAILTKIRVIARALPSDKSRMVKISQELNLVVGMTGDGVNDSPALKRADVGFGMGSGTEAAKEASDLVIIDDNFLSIKNAIWYGRTIYHNILKFCKFQLSINVGAVLVSALLPFIGIEEPLTVTHLLFVNLVMDSLGALLIGKEPADEVYMTEKPRRRDESLINFNMFTQFTVIGVYLLIMSVFWFKSSLCRAFFATDLSFKTGFFAVFMISSILNGFNVRTNSLNIFKNIKENSNFLPVLTSMLFATWCVCQASVVAPIIGEMFSTQAFDLSGWIWVVMLSLLILPLDAIRKIIGRVIKNV